MLILFRSIPGNANICPVRDMHSQNFQVNKISGNKKWQEVSQEGYEGSNHFLMDDSAGVVEDDSRQINRVAVWSTLVKGSSSYYTYCSNKDWWSYFTKSTYE